jgi:hypothetical protein
VAFKAIAYEKPRGMISIMVEPEFALSIELGYKFVKPLRIFARLA